MCLKFMEEVISPLVQVNLIDYASKIVFEFSFLIFNIEKEICDILYIFFYYNID
jgi:hypothetical protein